MYSLSFLDARRGLEATLRKTWEEFFNLTRFVYENYESVNLRLDNVLKHIAISDPTEALHDPRYEQYFKDFLENSNVRASQYIRIFEDENGQLDWEAPICTNAWDWLWFITYSAIITRLDALSLTFTVIENKKKKYFYLKWLGVLYGENIKIEEYEVRKINKEKNEPSKTSRWKIDRKFLSLGYIPVRIDEKLAEKIQTGTDLKILLLYLSDEKAKETLNKALLIREVIYLAKYKFREIQILERLFPILRSKRKKLPYPKWFDKHTTLTASIFALKRLLYPELEEKHGKWFEFWEIFC